MSNRIQEYQKNVNLDPCPFCGNPVKMTFDLNATVKGIFCPTCKMFMKFNSLLNRGASAEEWEKAWNTRR